MPSSMEILLLPHGNHVSLTGDQTCDPGKTAPAHRVACEFHSLARPRDRPFVISINKAGPARTYLEQYQLFAVGVIQLGKMFHSPLWYVTKGQRYETYVVC